MLLRDCLGMKGGGGGGSGRREGGEVGSSGRGRGRMKKWRGVESRGGVQGKGGSRVARVARVDGLMVW